MKRLKLAEYAFRNPSTGGIGAKNTISSGPDNGANNLLASHFEKPMRHGTTRDAVNNGTAALAPADVLSSTGELNIGGHGNEGLLETGMGQDGAWDPGQIIMWWNEDNWGPELDRIPPTPVTQVSIWSCHTGAGQDGADLLFTMAKRCQRAVRAGTGFLYSNSKQTWWENGSQWQVATPTVKPAPIPAPSAHGFMMNLPVFEVGGNEVQASDVAQVEFTPRFLGGKSAAPKTLQGPAAQAAVASLFQSPPMEMNVSIAGMVTGTLRLNFSGGQAITFDIYNDRLAVDSASRTGYYLKPSLRALYDSLR